MPRLTGLSDRDAGLGAKIAFFFTKRRFKQIYGAGNRDNARAATDVCVYPQAAQRIWPPGTGGGEDGHSEPPASCARRVEVGDFDPEYQAMLAHAVGMALFVILDTLAPAERLAFVLHDVFAVPFDQIAPVVERTPEATRKLASRARQRIQQAAPSPDTDLVAQHTVVDAFFAAGRAGDLDRLVAVLDPDVSLRGDFGPAGQRSVREASTVAGLARGYAAPEREVRPAVVNGAAGAVIFVDGRATAIMGFVVRGGRIAAIDVLADPERIARIDLRAVTG
jgi:ketosteroid isomerase-like protein